MTLSGQSSVITLVRQASVIWNVKLPAFAGRQPRTLPPVKKSITVTAEQLHNLLGPIKFFSEVAERTSEAGVATGLAWTQAGGDILFIEATSMPGTGKLMLTGQLGDVMKESAQAAMSYIRAKVKKLGITFKDFNKYDFHIHIPAGAIPKDGPSAGVTMAMSLIRC